jgi:hypothetical protein
MSHAAINLYGLLSLTPTLAGERGCPQGAERVLLTDDKEHCNPSLVQSDHFIHYAYHARIYCTQKSAKALPVLFLRELQNPSVLEAYAPFLSLA